MATNLPALLERHRELVEVRDTDQIMASRMRFSLIAVAVLVLVFGGAAAIVPIGGAIIGSGQVSVESRVKRIAHPQGGIVADIAVRNGDHVEAGQVLMRLDDTVTEADASYSTLSVYQLLAQRSRLEAERLGSSAITFPSELTQSPSPGAIQAMADERRLADIRRSEMSGQIAQLNARVAQYNEQIAGFQGQIGALQKQTALIEPERKGVDDLWQKGLVTISRRNQLERTAVDLEGSVSSLRSNIAEAQARITEAREQMIQLGETRRSTAGTELARINEALNQQQVRSVSAGDQQDRSLIRAPYSGVIDKLAFGATGEVVRPAETILEIVPDSDTLLVEGSISPGDIDQASVGQSARLRFSAFNSTATPEVRGKLIYVAAERTTNPDTQQSFYPVRIEIDQADLRAANLPALKPGMPAELFIETGSRSMMSYITKPLSDQLARAFRN